MPASGIKLEDANQQMKAVLETSQSETKLRSRKPRRLQMTKQLARQRAVGNPKAPKFDGAAFLRSLKK